MQTVLLNYFEDIRNVNGASGQGKPRRLEFLRCNLDSPSPIIADEAPAPVDPPLQDSPLTCRRGHAFAAGRGRWRWRGPQGQDKEVVNWVVLDEPSATLC